MHWCESCLFYEQNNRRRGCHECIRDKSRRGGERFSGRVTINLVRRMREMLTLCNSMLKESRGTACLLVIMLEERRNIMSFLNMLRQYESIRFVNTLRQYDYPKENRTLRNCMFVAKLIFDLFKNACRRSFYTALFLLKIWPYSRNSCSSTHGGN